MHRITKERYWIVKHNAMIAARADAQKKIAPHV